MNGSCKMAQGNTPARAKYRHNTGKMWTKSVYVPCNLRISAILRLRGSFSSQLEVPHAPTHVIIHLPLSTCHGEVYVNIAREENGWGSCGKFITLLTFELSTFREKGFFFTGFSTPWPLILLVRRLKAREGRIKKTDTHTDAQDNYCNPLAHARQGLISLHPVTYSHCICRGTNLKSCW